MANEVRIKLTAEQKAKIKAATGTVLSEIRVGSLGSSPTVSSTKALAARTQLAARNMRNAKTLTARNMRNAKTSTLTARNMRNARSSFEG